jgi:ribosomal 50S subunit-recycling heat shock protein
LAGSIFVKARTALKALCEAGKVWIKGDSPANGDINSPYSD